MPAALQVTVPFVWRGMVLAISFPETPLQFRVPGTVPLGLGIGRLLFRALNAAELALAVTLTLALLLSDAGAVSLGGAATTMLIAIWVLLLVQVALLAGPCRLTGAVTHGGCRSASALGGRHAVDRVR